MRNPIGVVTASVTQGVAQHRVRLADPRPADIYNGPLPSVDGTAPPWPGKVEVVDLAGRRGRAAARGRAHPTGIFSRPTPFSPATPVSPESPASPAVPGPADAPRALYVHGLGGSSTNWTDFAALLAGTVRGTAIDLPGYGRSDPAPGGDYSIRSQARYVAAHIESGGADPVHLVGNSMGGLISVEVAATRPDLVRTLTLVSPAMPFYRPVSGSDPRLALMALPGVSRMIERRMADVDPQVRAQAVIDLVFADASRVPPRRLAEQVDEVRERAGLPWAEDAFARSLRALIASFLRPGADNPWRLARRISAPTVVVWGEKDKLVNVRLAPRVSAAIPGAGLLVLAGVGHTAQLEAPEPTARAALGLIVGV